MPIIYSNKSEITYNTKIHIIISKSYYLSKKIKKKHVNGYEYVKLNNNHIFKLKITLQQLLLLQLLKITRPKITLQNNAKLVQILFCNKHLNEMTYFEYLWNHGIQNEIIAG